MVSKNSFSQGWWHYYRRKREGDADINPSTQTRSAEGQPPHDEHEIARRGVGRDTVALLFVFLNVIRLYDISTEDYVCVCIRGDAHGTYAQKGFPNEMHESLETTAVNEHYTSLCLNANHTVGNGRQRCDDNAAQELSAAQREDTTVACLEGRCQKCQWVFLK